MFDVNVEGVYNGAWAAYQYMKANNAGVIINTASVTGIFGSTSGVGYPASKAAVVGFTHELGRELVRRNIRVVAVAPRRRQHRHDQRQHGPPSSRSSTSSTCP